MQLDSLSLEDLTILQDRLRSVAAAMHVLTDCGFAPRADLSPGPSARISFDEVLPTTRAFADNIPFNPVVYPPRPTVVGVDHGMDVPVEVTVHLAPPAIDFTDRRPVADPVVPGSARALAQTVQPSRWTEEEDARAVDLCVEALMSGMTQSAAHMSVAEKLGRPVEGTKFRFGTKLKDRVRDAMDAAIDGSVARALKAGADVATLEVTAPEPTVEAAPPVAAPDPHLPDMPTDLLGAHLASVDRKRGWTMARDLDLIDLACAGWEMAAIGAELHIDAGDVKRRYDLLTDQHRDKSDKLVRRFTRDQVLERLKALMPAQAAE
jgi:hypothetical protein